MTFAEWEALPAYERRHRTLLYLADREREADQMEEMQREQFIREIERDRGKNAPPT